MELCPCYSVAAYCTSALRAEGLGNHRSRARNHSLMLALGERTRLPLRCVTECNLAKRTSRVLVHIRVRLSLYFYGIVTP